MTDDVLLTADMNQPETAGKAAGLLISGLWLAGLMLVSFVSGRYLQQELLQELDSSAATISEQLSMTLRPYDEVADGLSRMRLVREALAEKEKLVSLQRFLLQTNDEMGTESMFILDTEGRPVGSSRNLGAGFSAHDFSFRPYFQQAILGEPGRYYATGAVTAERGYYFSAPVSDHGQVIGVVVVKVNLERLFQDIAALVPDYLLLGYDGVVFAASRPAWLYNSLYPLADSQQAAVRNSRRFRNPPLNSLTSDSLDDVFHNDSIRLKNAGLSSVFYARRVRLPELGWHVFALSPSHILYQRIMLHVLYYSTAFAVLLLLWMYQRKRTEVQRHVALLNRELEKRVAALTRELRDSNAELQELVNHYQTTQTQLQETRDQLVQTAKLAVLGEMSAGINHELNQPLLALNTYTENSLRLAARGQYELVEKNLQEILHITDSMRGIVSRFKVFARRTPPEPRAAEVQEVLAGTGVIIKPLLKKSGVRLETGLEAGLPALFCDPLQLQQVLVNLLTNAVEALEEQDDAWIRITVRRREQQIEMRVCDSGPGIAAELRGKVFEPFFTTKARGLGLGLALSRRIIETLGGSLTLTDNGHGGTCFVLLLPVCPTSESGESE